MEKYKKFLAFEIMDNFFDPFGIFGDVFSAKNTKIANAMAGWICYKMLEDIETFEDLARAVQYIILLWFHGHRSRPTIDGATLDEFATALREHYNNISELINNNPDYYANFPLAK